MFPISDRCDTGKQVLRTVGAGAGACANLSWRSLAFQISIDVTDVTDH